MRVAVVGQCCEHVARGHFHADGEAALGNQRARDAVHRSLVEHDGAQMRMRRAQRAGINAGAAADVEHAADA